MAAGLSRSQVYDRIRRLQVKNLNRLRRAGVPCQLKKNQISFQDELDVGGGFNIYYHHGNASNGESIITCKITIHPPRTQPDVKVLGIDADHHAGMNIIEKWFTMLCEIKDLPKGAYFATSDHPTNPGTAYLHDEHRLIRRLHDGAYVTGLFSGYPSKVWLILKDKAALYAQNYRKQLAA